MGLPTPSSEAGRAGLAALLDRPGAALLGLDFDGTLAPIVPDPDIPTPIVPDPDIPAPGPEPVDPPAPEVPPPAVDGS